MTRSLVLDIQAIQNPASRSRGLGRYVREHSRALTRIDGLVKARLLSPWLPDPVESPDAADGTVLWNTAASLRSLNNEEIAYHIMSPFEAAPSSFGVVVPHALDPAIPLVTTLYDLIPLVMKDVYLRDPFNRRRYEARCSLLRASDLVLAISEHSRQDAIRLVGLHPGRVAVIGAGVAPAFHQQVEPSVDRQLLLRYLPDVRDRFILTVTGSDPRKNTEGLLEAYAHLPRDLRKDLQLVVVGSLLPEFESRWLQQMRGLALSTDDVLFAGSVPDEQLAALYRQADLFVFPSHYEGFGLPVIEAIASGCPAIASDTSSMPELLGLREATFDPRDPLSMTRAIQRYFEDSDFARRLRDDLQKRAPDHTWDAVADRTARALRGLSSYSSDAPRPRHVGILIEEGVASDLHPHMVKIASRLARTMRIDLFAPAPLRSTRLRLAGVRSFANASLNRSLPDTSYDVMVRLGPECDGPTILSVAQPRPPSVVAETTQRVVRMSGAWPEDAAMLEAAVDRLRTVPDVFAPQAATR